MSIAVDAVRNAAEPVFELFASPITYQREEATYTGLLATARGMRGDELFGSAAQGDKLLVVFASSFSALGIDDPKRFDKVTLASGIHTVIDWRPAPAVGDPVWYRIVIRGGTQ